MILQHQKQAEEAAIRAQERVNQFDRLISEADERRRLNSPTLLTSLSSGGFRNPPPPPPPTSVAQQQQSGLMNSLNRTSETNSGPTLKARSRSASAKRKAAAASSSASFAPSILAANSGFLVPNSVRNPDQLISDSLSVVPSVVGSDVSSVLLGIPDKDESNPGTRGCEVSLWWITRAFNLGCLKINAAGEL